MGKNYYFDPYIIRPRPKYQNTYLYVAFHNDMKTTGNEWVLVNLNITGYYRVNYDTENWERLLNQLTENHEVKTLALGVMHYK